MPFFGRLGGRPDIVFGGGYSGNGVGPTFLGGRMLASLALGLEDEWAHSAGLSSRVEASRRSRSATSARTSFVPRWPGRSGAEDRGKTADAVTSSWPGSLRRSRSCQEERSVEAASPVSTPPGVLFILAVVVKMLWVEGAWGWVLVGVAAVVEIGETYVWRPVEPHAGATGSARKRWTGRRRGRHGLPARRPGSCAGRDWGAGCEENGAPGNRVGVDGVDGITLRVRRVRTPSAV